MSSRSERFAVIGDLTTKLVKLQDKRRYLVECRGKLSRDDFYAIEEYNKQIEDIDAEISKREKEVKDMRETYRTEPEEEYSPDEELMAYDAYNVRRMYRELFPDDYDDIRYDVMIDDWGAFAQWMTDNRYTEEVEDMKPEIIIDDSVIGKLKSSVAIPEEFKFADNMTFYTMLRNIFRNKYILVPGPSGCGKS